MDEKVFDQKIRESAQKHETQMEKPLWNKEGVWNRVDSGLEKNNHSVGWKAAAVILILLSTGWSFAQWNNFRKYKQEKEMELSELQQQLNQSIAWQKDNIHEEQIIIQRQNQNLDSLKKQILMLSAINRKKETRRPPSEKFEATASQERQINQENLIDSLHEQLKLAQKTMVNMELARLTEEKTPVKPENPVVSREVAPERHIYYISSHNQPQSMKKGRGFKIGFWGLSEDQNIEYQSDHSIFKK